ncbi:hypothetical protein EC973_009049 [Apophysomyces ossiformis]|uniref:Uncharacterized protein n=1 Tax=Apophysomyces ossiformis TaxID=679940 RepID=A0A8H7BPQ7_9FUNG|nr:hypothetical protein EC973_009049 [Apophysomyces ossiformis]
MLRPPSSLVVEGMLVYSYDEAQPQYDSDDENEPMIVIPQNLAPEQYNYEFPPKSLLRELEYLDQDERVNSFFDESSFTTTSTSTAACLSVFPTTDSSLSSMSQLAYHTDDDHLHNSVDSIDYTQSSHMAERTPWSQQTYRTEEDLRIEYEDGLHLVDDTQLSPLQLPAQSENHHLRHPQYRLRPHSSNGLSPACSDERRLRELSCDSTTTVTQRHSPRHSPQPVAPSSFLSVHKRSLLGNLSCVDEEEKSIWDEPSFGSHSRVTQNITESCWHAKVSPYHGAHSPCQTLSRRDSEDDDDFELPVIIRESELIMDYDSDNESDLGCDDKVFIKLNRSLLSGTSIQLFPANQSSFGTDEGYEDEEAECEADSEAESEEPIESTSVFLPLETEKQLNDRDLVRETAATKIQAVWRGYQSRKQNVAKHMKPTHFVAFNLIRVCDSIHRRQMARMEERMYAFEKRLQQERKMRMAFEQAMEEMTSVIDRQQEILDQRVEQEVQMRQAYERKMQTALAQMQPLEESLLEEVQARKDLENKMANVLSKVEEMTVSQQRRAQEDAEAKQILQQRLDEALKEIEALKENQQQQKQQQQQEQRPQPSSVAQPPLPSSQPQQQSKPQPRSSNTPSIRAKPARPASRATNVPARVAQQASAAQTTAKSTTRRTIVPSPQSRVSNRSETKRPTTVPGQTSTRKTANRRL